MKTRHAPVHPWTRPLAMLIAHRTSEGNPTPHTPPPGLKHKQQTVCGAMLGRANVDGHRTAIKHGLREKCFS